MLYIIKHGATEENVDYYTIEVDIEHFGNPSKF